jgi:hypothetical protein
MFIKVKNLLPESSSYSYLSNGESSGTNALRVKNINSFESSQALQVGKTKEEVAEIVMSSAGAVSGTSVSLTANTRFDHPTDTPVYAIRFDQVIFKRSTTGTAGTATAWTSSTVTITPDSEYTQFYDTTGATTYAYKAAYYNSVTTEESTDSDWILPTGESQYSLAKMRERIKRKLISSNYIQSDEIITDWINEWLEKMTNAAIDVNRDYLLGTQSIPVTSGQEMGTITSSDFKELRKMSIVTAAGTATAARMNLTDFRADQVFTESLPMYYWKGDNVFGRKPIDNNATIVVDYYKMPTKLTNDTDELPISMWNYTKSFIDYGYAQACFLDQKDEKGYAFINMANGELAQFKTEIAPRWKSGTQYVTIVSPLSSEDDFQLI